MFEVVADFPGNHSEAQAIAVLIWSAAKSEGLSIEQFQARVMAAIADYYLSPVPEAPKPRGGQPAFDWDDEYGKQARDIEFAAVIRRAAKPSLTKTAARVAALREAKFQSNDKLARDAERLKQIMSLRMGKTILKKLS